MSFTVQIGVTNSPRIQVSKDVTYGHTYECTLKDKCSILDPVIILSTSSNGVSNLSGNNYMYIPSFGRYYYITDIISVRSSIVEIHGHVDVLMSYKDDIYKQTGVVSRTSSTKYYTSGLEDKDSYQYSDSKIVVRKLSTNNGFTKDGSYVLVTAGPSGESGTVTS